jgi:hypothetical protein
MKGWSVNLPLFVEKAAVKKIRQCATQTHESGEKKKGSFDTALFTRVNFLKRNNKN